MTQRVFNRPNLRAAPEGQVIVADAPRYLMYHESYGDTERARRLDNALPGEARQIEGVDFAAATEACPQGIDMAGRLHQAQRELEGLA
ncbi:MAG: hypothetical protein V3T00_01210 [bacterium]